MPGNASSADGAAANTANAGLIQLVANASIDIQALASVRTGNGIVTGSAAGADNVNTVASNGGNITLTATNGSLFPGLAKLLQPVLAHHFEEAIPALITRASVHLHQRLVDERDEQVENRASAPPIRRAADGFGGSDGHAVAPAGDDAWARRQGHGGPASCYQPKHWRCWVRSHSQARTAPAVHAGDADGAG